MTSSAWLFGAHAGEQRMVKRVMEIKRWGQESCETKSWLFRSPGLALSAFQPWPSLLEWKHAITVFMMLCSTNCVASEKLWWGVTLGCLQHHMNTWLDAARDGNGILHLYSLQHIFFSFFSVLCAMVWVCELKVTPDEAFLLQNFLLVPEQHKKCKLRTYFHI